MNARRIISLVALLLALLAVPAIIACDDSSDDAAANADVTVVARDYAYEMPEEVPAGFVTMTLRNEGTEPHHAQPARLNDGVTVEQFGAALQQDPASAAALITFPGGPGPVAAGGSQEVTLDLSEGQYLMLCFVESSDGTPHLAKGMMKPFRVVGSDDAGEEPPNDGEVTLRDFNFDLPELASGESTVQVTNAGQQVHEIGIVSLAEGTSVADVLAYLRDPQGPPPFTEMGGMQALDPNAAGWMHLDLAPGNYLAICFVPDENSGRPHVELGMLAEFTVE